MGQHCKVCSTMSTCSVSSGVTGETLGTVSVVHLCRLLSLLLYGRWHRRLCMGHQPAQVNTVSQGTSEPHPTPFAIETGRQAQFL